MPPLGRSARSSATHTPTSGVVVMYWWSWCRAWPRAPAGLKYSIDWVSTALVAEIRRDPAKPWRVAGLARRAGLGVDTFARRFRASVGVSPREFLVQARIDAAKAALRMTGDSIGAIAERLGFCDIYHFSRLFRQHAGRSPSAFRNGAS